MDGIHFTSESKKNLDNLSSFSWEDLLPLRSTSCQGKFFASAFFLVRDLGKVSVPHQSQCSNWCTHPFHISNSSILPSQPLLFLNAVWISLSKHCLHAFLLISLPALLVKFVLSLFFLRLITPVGSTNLTALHKGTRGVCRGPYSYSVT